MKRASLILLTLLLVLGIQGIGSAAEWALEAGVNYQFGKYELTISNTDDIETAIPFPSLRYTLDLSCGNWVGKGFYSASNLVKTESKGVTFDDPKGCSKTYGANLGYLFTYDAFSRPISILPSLGYQSLAVFSGESYSYSTGEDFYGSGFGQEAFRIGLQVMTDINEKLTLRASAGYSPLVRTLEYHLQSGEDEDGDYWGSFSFVPEGQKSWNFDVGLEGEYIVNSSISAVLGYNYMKGESKELSYSMFDVEKYEISGNSIYLGVKYLF